MSADIRKTGEKLWSQWTAMWNGKPALAEEIIAPGFWVHLTLDTGMAPEQLRDGMSVAKWVAGFRDRFERLVYSYSASPIVDLEQGVVTCPWVVDGVYAGRTKSPLDVPGKAFRKAGVDILRFRDGRISECWTLSNDVTSLQREVWDPRPGPSVHAG
jgi:hypothetical protein